MPVSTWSTLARSGLRVAGLVCVLGPTTAACVAGGDPRQVEIVSVMTTADESLILTRPELVASKYRAMARSPHDFLRGSFPLYVHDVGVNVWGLPPSAHHAEVAPFSVGDAHVENVGVLLGRDGVLSFQPNDLDAADRHPYLFEVRRLATSLTVATLSADADRSFSAQDIEPAQALARAYAARMKELAAGAPRATVDEVGDVLADVRRRGEKDLDDHEELEELTVVDGERRLLVRGSTDEDDPERVYVEAPDVVWAALDDALAAYRETLTDPPPPAFFSVKDVVREFGSGVASRARVRFILLVEGPTTALEDDVLLEMKELGDTGGRSVVAEEVSAEDPGERVLRATELCWTTPDAEPLWGVTSLLGLPVQVRLESAAEKSVRVARLVEELATREALRDLGRDLGVLLAEVHAGSRALDPGLLERISRAIGDDPETFAQEQAEAARVMGNLAVEDHARFVRALEELGPTLGLEPDASDALRGDAALLVGAPPEVE